MNTTYKNDINFKSDSYEMEFEQIVLRFGSFVSISKKQKYNFLTLLKLIIEDKKTQKLLCEMLGDSNIQSIIKLYLNNTPNIYKKIFRSKFNKKNHK